MVQNVVFDLGRVLLSFDHAISFAGFERCGASFRRETFYKDFLLDEYERGAIGGAEFLELIRRACPAGVELAALQSAWQDIFSPIEEMLELVGSLRPRHRVFILSNTCDLHWDFVEERFAISSLVDGTVTSFEARSRKPELEIYRFAEKKLGVSPASTVFIDDIELNARGAAAAGWHAIHHVTPESTKRELLSLGVRW